MFACGKTYLFWHLLWASIRTWGQVSIPRSTARHIAPRLWKKKVLGYTKHASPFLSFSYPHPPPLPFRSSSLSTPPLEPIQYSPARKFTIMSSKSVSHQGYSNSKLTTLKFTLGHHERILHPSTHCPLNTLLPTGAR